MSTGVSRASLRAAARSGVARAATVAPLEHAVSEVSLDKRASEFTPSKSRGDPSPRLMRAIKQIVGWVSLQGGFHCKT